MAVPEFYANFPEGVQIVLDSGITAASLTAILLNTAFDVLGKREQPSPTADATARAGEEVLTGPHSSCHSR